MSELNSALVASLADESRFWRKVIKTDECWSWIAGLDPDGYGNFWLNGQHRKAHRVSYRWLVGPISEGMVLDHLCRNRACVNPDHLEPVTRHENTKRGAEAGTFGKRGRSVTHCPQGHAYDSANTVIASTGRGSTKRRCRECERIRSARRRALAKRADQIEKEDR